MDMRRKKIAFFDIDGTLLQFGGYDLTPRVKQALHALQEQGIRIFICTGRPPHILPHFPFVTFDGAVCFNGGYCYDQTGVLHHSPIDKEDMKQIILQAKQAGFPILISTATHMGSNFFHPDLYDYMQISHHDCHVMSEEDYEKIQQEDVYQLMLPCYPGQEEKVLEGVRRTRSVRWWERATDLVDETCSKSHGIEMVLRSYGLGPEDAMAFGDGTNDVDMISYVSLGIAMGNAADPVRAVADYITDTCEEDGIYTALKHFGYL